LKKILPLNSHILSITILKRKMSELDPRYPPVVKEYLETVGLEVTNQNARTLTARVKNYLRRNDLTTPGFEFSVSVQARNRPTKIYSKQILRMLIDSGLATDVSKNPTDPDLQEINDQTRRQFLFPDLPELGRPIGPVTRAETRAQSEPPISAVGQTQASTQQPPSISDQPPIEAQTESAPSEAAVQDDLSELAEDIEAAQIENEIAEAATDTATETQEAATDTATETQEAETQKSETQATETQTDKNDTVTKQLEQEFKQIEKHIRLSNPEIEEEENRELAKAQRIMDDLTINPNSEKVHPKLFRAMFPNL
jgi:hypothetical protein